MTSFQFQLVMRAYRDKVVGVFVRFRAPLHEIFMVGRVSRRRCQSGMQEFLHFIVAAWPENLVGAVEPSHVAKAS
jgi:hypothetical protein